MKAVTHGGVGTGEWGEGGWGGNKISQQTLIILS